MFWRKFPGVPGRWGRRRGPPRREGWGGGGRRSSSAAVGRPGRRAHSESGVAPEFARAPRLPHQFRRPGQGALSAGRRGRGRKPSQAQAA